MQDSSRKYDVDGYIDGHEIEDLEIDSKKDLKNILFFIYEEKVESANIEFERGRIEIRKGFASGIKVKVKEGGDVKESINVGLPIKKIVEDIERYSRGEVTKHIKFRGESLNHTIRYYIYKSLMLIVAPMTLLVFISGVALIPMQIMGILFPETYESYRAWDLFDITGKRFPFITLIFGLGVALFHYAGSVYEKELNESIQFRSLGVDGQFTTQKKGFLVGVWMAVLSLLFAMSKFLL